MVVRWRPDARASERERGVTSRWRKWCVLVRCVDAPAEEANDRSMYRKQRVIFLSFVVGCSRWYWQRKNNAHNEISKVPCAAADESSFTQSITPSSSISLSLSIHESRVNIIQLTPVSRFKSTHASVSEQDAARSPASSSPHFFCQPQNTANARYMAAI